MDAIAYAIGFSLPFVFIGLVIWAAVKLIRNIGK